MAHRSDRSGWRGGRRRGAWLAFYAVLLAAWIVAVPWLTLSGLEWTPERLALPAVWIVILLLAIVGEVRHSRRA